MPVTLQQDKCPAIRFEKGYEEDRNESIKQGRYVPREVNLVFVKQIGDKDEVECKAEEWLEKLKVKAYGLNGNPPQLPVEWYERAEKLYDNFKKGYENQPDGFPVTEWPVLTPAQVKNMHSMETYTIEQVAAWTEQAIQRFGMGGRELKHKAELWLKSGDEKAEKIVALEVENESLKSRLEKLERLVQEQIAANAEDRPQRGRPRKDVEIA
jgi:hypothetical protein